MSDWTSTGIVLEELRATRNWLIPQIGNLETLGARDEDLSPETETFSFPTGETIEFEVDPGAATTVELLAATVHEEAEDSLDTVEWLSARADAPGDELRDLRLVFFRALEMSQRYIGGGRRPTVKGQPGRWQEFTNEVICDDSRHLAAMSYIGHLLAVLPDRGEAYNLARFWNACRCRPPLPQDEFHSIFMRIAARELVG
jgi:hypothetical protein